MIQRDSINYIFLHTKHRLILSDFHETWLFPTVLINTQVSNFTKIRPSGAELFPTDIQTDGQTDMTKLIAAFHNIANNQQAKNTVRAQEVLRT
jgi:hypothetical protein